MGKSGKPGYYAVARGRVPGIYSSWDECQVQTAGFAGNKHQKFSSLEQARQYLSQHGVAAAVPPPSAATASAVASSSTTPNLQTASSKRARTHRTKPYARVQSSLSSAAGNTAKPRNAQWATLTKEIIEDESGWDVVYSDGACKGNGKVGAIAGIGVWWAENYPSPCFRHWMPKWIANNFKTSSGEAVKNAHLIQYLSSLLDERVHGMVHLQCIKGHAGHEGNEGADRIANLGATLPAQPERDWKALMIAKSEPRARLRQSGLLQALPAYRMLSSRNTQRALPTMTSGWTR
ncbi:ribonuclease H-like protein [Trametes coccinea BRFM310]|uniref:Ribonuclease H n=1 Tax=Trametes coccinea (strain BRFM310) TaxID=1353009 RepID=A0A1Y2I8K9_TRAC3|nr:ribonuclease H-like protein [Trametes coccinea BRFM310]